MNFFKAAVEIHGEQAQLEMVIEECAELIKAIQKYKRKKSIPNITAIVEEATDVDLMIKQLRYIFPDPNAWKVVKRDKVKRLINNLKKHRKAEINSYIKKLEKP